MIDRFPLHSTEEFGNQLRTSLESLSSEIAHFLSRSGDYDHDTDP
jgi:hypothetical protein